MDEVAGAIADPVRREILAMLRERRMSAGQIADRFAISRPAVSRHLRVLRASGLVHDELTGRRRFYRLDPAPLAALVEWLTPFLPDGGAGAWERRFDALETEVYRTRREHRRSPAAERSPATGQSSAATAEISPATGRSSPGERSATERPATAEMSPAAGRSSAGDRPAAGRSPTAEREERSA